MKKGFIGLVLALIFVGAFSLIESSIWMNSKIHVLIAIAVMASIYQPSYSPFKKAANDLDQGTALQIIWSIYASQFLCLLEAIYFNYSSSMQWTPIAIGAAVLALFGLVLRSWAYKELGDFFTWHINVESDQKVVKTGPYKIVCHPSYTGAFMTYMFTCVMLHSFYAAAASFILMFLCFKRRITYEEKEMIKELGDEYKIFCNSRSKLIPFVW
jgi:protein-S-isoprenylcysteine O-methyltransferase